MNKRIRINGKLYEAVVPADRWGLTTEEGDVPSGWHLTWDSIDNKSYATRHYTNSVEGLATKVEITLQKDLPAQVGIRINNSGYIFLDFVEADNDTTTGEILDRVDTALDQVAKYIAKHPILALSNIFSDDNQMTTDDITRIFKKYLDAVD